MKQLDPCTFGSSKAAIILADMLNISGNNKYCKTVSRCFNDFTKGFWEIQNIRNASCKMAIMDLWINKSVDRINGSNLPEKIKSYLINVEKTINGMYYKILRERRIKEIKIKKERSRNDKNNRR